jgi:hypothetical protein
MNFEKSHIEWIQIHLENRTGIFLPFPIDIKFQG